MELRKSEANEVKRSYLERMSAELSGLSISDHHPIFVGCFTK
jgi:hypothetical protein